MDNLIACTDPRGRTIILTDRQWRMHILPNHAELGGNEDAVAITLRSLDVIARDAERDSRESYYRVGALGGHYAGLFLKVSVQFVTPDENGAIQGTVITAYPTRRIKQGEDMLWP